jgi:hypothetical protein
VPDALSDGAVAVASAATEGITETSLLAAGFAVAAFPATAFSPETVAGLGAEAFAGAAVFTDVRAAGPTGFKRGIGAAGGGGAAGGLAARAGTPAAFVMEGTAAGAVGGFTAGLSTVRTRSAIWSGTTLSWFFASKTPPKRSLKREISSFEESPTSFASSNIRTLPVAKEYSTKVGARRLQPCGKGHFYTVI